MNDQELHHFLRKQPVHVELPKNFHRQVWSRIEMESSRGVSQIIRELLESGLSHFTNPKWAAATFTLCAISGLGLGLLEQRAEQDDRAALRYQQSVNPLFRAGGGEVSP